MSQLRPITETCVPRDDVLRAAWPTTTSRPSSTRSSATPTTTRSTVTPTRSSRITYPTAGLHQLLTSTFGRSPAPHPRRRTRRHPRLTTTFGGGKTHGPRSPCTTSPTGARPSNSRRVHRPGAHSRTDRPGRRGRRRHPRPGERPRHQRPSARTRSGARSPPSSAPTRTRSHGASDEEPHGARQARPRGIVGDAADHRHHRRDRPPPPPAHVRRATRGRPSHGGGVPGVPQEPLRARGGPRTVVVIITLATHADAYGQETDEISDPMDEAASGLRGARRSR